MTSGVVAVVHCSEGQYSDEALSIVAATQQVAEYLGREAVVVVLPLDQPDSLPEVAWDLSEIVVVDNSGEQLDGLTTQQIVGDFLTGFDSAVVLMSNTGLTIEFAAAISAAKGFGFGGNLQSLFIDSDSLTATRARYGGKVVETLGFDINRTNILAFSDGAFPPEPVSRNGGSPPTRRLVTNNAASVKRISVEQPAVGEVDITKSQILLAIGRGVGSEEGVGRFAAIADRIGATLASTRPLVDVGWVSPERQVGQSGKTVKPKVYLALGISGSMQHIAGMRQASTVIAVNSDASAPIFDLAHYGAVMDLEDLAAAFESSFESN